MVATVKTLREIGASIIPAKQHRGVMVLGFVSLVLLLGLTVTGLYQFLTHEPSPQWYSHQPGRGQRLASVPSEGISAVHGAFGDAAFVVALIGGAWFCLRIAFGVPRLVPVSIVLLLAGLVSGSFLRFNGVKLEGRTLEEADDGYGQIFLNDVDYVVTDRFEYGETAIRVLTIGHVLTLPVLVLFAWMFMKAAASSLQRLVESTPERRWSSNVQRGDAPE